VSGLNGGYYTGLLNLAEHSSNKDYQALLTDLVLQNIVNNMSTNSKIDIVAKLMEYIISENDDLRMIAIERVFTLKDIADGAHSGYFKTVVKHVISSICAMHPETVIKFAESLETMLNLKDC
jgi:hypothetical protein